jgi:ABC-type enterobactin transport system permease subunit
MLGPLVLGWLSAVAAMVALMVFATGIWKIAAAYIVTGIVVSVSAAVWNGYRDELLRRKARSHASLRGIPEASEFTR